MVRSMIEALSDSGFIQRLEIPYSIRHSMGLIAHVLWPDQAG
jgi:hypothetical protein